MPVVAVIDDEPMIRDLVEDCLRQAGYEAHSATSAESGAKLLASRYFDLALIDVLLQDNSGIRLAQFAADQNTPVVLMTGHVETAVRLRQFDFPRMLKPVQGTSTDRSSRSGDRRPAPQRPTPDRWSGANAREFGRPRHGDEHRHDRKTATRTQHPPTALLIRRQTSRYDHGFQDSTPPYHSVRRRVYFGRRGTRAGLQHGPYVRGLRRHLEVPGSGIRAERVDDRVHDRGRCRTRTGFSTGLRSEDVRGARSGRYRSNRHSVHPSHACQRMVETGRCHGVQQLVRHRRTL